MKIITGKNEVIEQIKLTHIHPDPENRKVGGFDEEKLKELSRSIKSIGVQQPIILRKSISGASYEYDLVAGERRWRASKIAGNETIPAVVRDLSDADVLHIQVIENIQREDIHPLDECNGYFRLLSGSITYTTSDIANEVGKSESYVSQRLRLKHLIPKAVEAFEENKILLGHAILIARLEPDDQKKSLKYTLPAHEWDSLRPVKYLHEWIESEIYLNLTKAAFPKKADNLIKEADSCLNCRKRTDWDPALFPEIDDEAFCLDKECFNKKIEQHLEKQKKIERPYIAGDWSYQTPEGDAYRQHEVTRWNPEWDDPENKEYMQAPDKLTFEECLVVTGPERGKVVLARIDTGEDEEENPEVVAQYKAEEREKVILKIQFEKLNKKLYDATLEKQKVKGFQLDAEMLRMIIKMLFSDDYYGSDLTLEAYDIKEPEQEMLEKLQNLTIYNLREFIIHLVIEKLIPEWWMDEDTLLLNYAESKEVDVESLTLEAAIEAEAEYEENHQVHPEVK